MFCVSQSQGLRQRLNERSAKAPTSLPFIRLSEMLPRLGDRAAGGPRRGPRKVRARLAASDRAGFRSCLARACCVAAAPLGGARSPGFNDPTAQLRPGRCGPAGRGTGCHLGCPRERLEGRCPPGGLSVLAPRGGAAPCFFLGPGFGRGGCLGPGALPCPNLRPRERVGGKRGQLPGHLCGCH